MAQEKNTENLIKKYLEQRRLMGSAVFFFKQFQNGGTIDGLPDILCCINGYFLGIEVKAYDGTVSRDQKIVIKDIVKADGWVVVVDDAQVFIQWFESVFLAKRHHCMRGYFYNLSQTPVFIEGLNKEQQL